MWYTFSCIIYVAIFRVFVSIYIFMHIELLKSKLDKINYRYNIMLVMFVIMWAIFSSNKLHRLGDCASSLVPFAGWWLIDCGYVGMTFSVSLFTLKGYIVMRGFPLLIVAFGINGEIIHFTDLGPNNKLPCFCLRNRKIKIKIVQ